MNADRAAYLQDHHHEDRRKSDRRVSPAVGDFALAERPKLLALLAEAQDMRPTLLKQLGYVPECVLDFCNKARAAVKVPA